MDIKDYLQEKRALVEKAFEIYAPQSEGLLADHFASMLYSLHAGGKRIRPILCLAAAEALNRYSPHFLTVAVALECIHTYSLIHDDLPAMDDDALRRGKPTNHMVYGEAAAILAGDGLLSHAFELLSTPELASELAPEQQLRLIHLVSAAIGPKGMVGGQALDIASENTDIPFDTLKTIHKCKTGALITASVQCGALLGNADQQQFDKLTIYGQNVGLAFQIVDDLLNVIGTTEQLGKQAGSDAARNKATYPAFFGVEETRQRARDAVTNALNALENFDQKATPLRALAEYIYSRTC